MKKRAFQKLICLILVCATLLISVSVTLAWLASGTTMRDFPDDFSGLSESAYFAGGDGSPGDPYIIKNAVHLYNLAWLQYLGYFNMRSDFNNGRAQSHFRLDDNITMTGIVLPPIGTMQYPFIGSFNGNGKTVYGLTTSNLKTDFGSRYPSTAEFSGANLLTYCKVGNTADSTVINIVGMFGVVGDYNTWITRNYTSGLEVKDYTVTPPTSADEDGNDANILYRAGMSVRSFYISRAKVKTYAAETLVGLAAGFLSAAMKKVGVYHSEIIVGNKNATGMTVQKSDGLDTYGTKVSLYSLIGDFDSAVVDWDGTSGSGTAPTWGGSIDMSTLRRRLTYMYAMGSKSSYVSTSTDFGTRLYAYSGAYDWRGANAGRMYLEDTTFLPLNVDNEVMGLDDWDSNETTTSDGYTTNKYYSANNKETVLSSNTGYIVGNSSGERSTVSVFLRTLAGTSGYINPDMGIMYSFAESSLPAETVDGVSYAAGVYNPTRFAMYTMKKNSSGILQTYRIIDEKNSANKDNFTNYVNVAGTLSPSDFKRYSGVRSGVDAMLGGFNTYHAIRLDSYSSTQAISNNAGSPTYTLTDDGKNIKGGINFTLAEKGYITVVLASALSIYGKSSLFDLYKVNIGTDDKVSSATPIKIVSTDKNGTIYYDGVDKNGNAASADVTEVIDLEALQSQVMQSKCVYYFEIPVDEGQYFISNAKDAKDSSHLGAFIMYLDIGANGNTETPSDKPYSMEGVNYVDREEVADPANFPEYSRVTFVLDAVKNATGEYAYVIFHRDSTDGETTDGVIKTKVHYKADGLTATPTGTDVSEDETLTEPAYTGN